MTAASSSQALVRLLQLCSPSLPVGGFTYSQGLEWAVECGWVDSEAKLEAWLEGLLHDGLAGVDLPILARLYAAVEADDSEALRRWSRELIACRETAELRAEERARGKAMTSLLVQLEVAGAAELRETLRLCQAAGFALAASRWGVSLEEAATGYAWTWLENLVLAGVKLIPLGQTAGQRLSLALGAKIPAAVNHGLGLADPAIGASAPAAALASSLHETQYTRLFRS